jgi:4'-phosphopantetheinyl transferase
MVLHIQSLQQVLTANEQRRAERFYFQKDRDRFIVTRGLLRTILSRYLDIEPYQVRFCYNHYGKPALARQSGADMLRFNVSHSQAMGLYVVARGREVGVDVERIRTDLAFEQIAKRFLSPREVAVLRALPVTMQREAFFKCWNRKEAYVKARGNGLSLPPNQFEVSVAPGEPAALLSDSGDPWATSRWSLRDLSPAPGYVAALAAEGQEWQLTCWQWEEG